MFNTKMLDKHGISGILDAFAHQIAGEANGPNFDPVVGIYVAKQIIQYGRSLRIQPLNSYRRQVGLPPYTTFEEMTDDPKTLEALKKLYQHPDAVEMFTGMFIEKRRPGGLFGATITQRGIPSTFQGVFGHPLLSEQYWRPSTYGGEAGWNIVNEPCTLEQLIRRNTPKWNGSGDGPSGKMRIFHSEEEDFTTLWVGIIVANLAVIGTIIFFCFLKKKPQTSKTPSKKRN
jgi:hypothetical protein